MRFEIAEHEDGARTIEIVERELEQRYGVGDDYACILFIAICRLHGARPYYRGSGSEGEGDQDRKGKGRSSRKR